MSTQTSDIKSVIQDWLKKRLDSTSLNWLTDRAATASAGDKKGLFLGFGMVPRKVGKSDLHLTDSELAQSASVRPGWNPRDWSIDQLSRTFLVLTFPSSNETEYVRTLDQLFQTGEVGELVSLYQALPLLPHPRSHVLRGAEGIRSNIKPVFCAVAHNNPFPSEFFNDEQWNQLVLKCLFIGESLEPVIGLDQRANGTLMRTLIDFAHERRAAHRPIPTELWRCVGPFADDSALDDLQLVLKTGDELERKAAADALQRCPNPRAKQILQS